jgi:cell division protein FtsW
MPGGLAATVVSRDARRAGPAPIGGPRANPLGLHDMIGNVEEILYEPYRLERLLNFTNPFADPFNKGFQLSQALIAFGRGEWLGVGLGHGIQKQFFLPEAHTDFLMAVVGEEFGFAGVTLVILAFSFLVWRTFDIGVRAQRQGDLFAAYLAHGLGLGLGLQAFINVGVNVGLLPTKGLTMPFMSYGSNSLIVAIMAIGVLLRIHRALHKGQDEPIPAAEDPWVRV